MTSLFTQFVARGVEVPVIDPRLIAHVDVLAVETQDDGPAAPASSLVDGTAPVDQQASSTDSGVAAGDGTTSPA